MRNVDSFEIKQRITLRSLLERDNVILRKSGSNAWSCLCPFHNEKSPSCVVHEDQGGDWFKCFGCGKRGDIFDYWSATRHVDFLTAKQSLAALAGFSSAVSAPPLPPRTRVDRPKQVRPMNEEIANRWRDGVQMILDSREEQARIAKWRGYRIGTVHAMAKAGLIGLPVYRGKRRESFPVRVPPGAGGNNEKGFIAGFHAHTPDLDGRWRFEPNGIGSWPFVIGETIDCRALVILEGQWDAIAFYDAISEEVGFPASFCVVGVRGSSNWRKLLEYKWPRTAQAFLFTDGDDAGREWLEPESLAGALRGRCRAVHAFTWRADAGVKVKDMNDAHIRWAGRVNGAALREMLRGYWKVGARTRRAAGGRGDDE